MQAEILGATIVSWVYVASAFPFHHWPTELVPTGQEREGYWGLAYRFLRKC